MPEAEKLGELRKLQTDWDSYGSPPIVPAIIDAAERLLQRLGDTSGVYAVPLSNGSLQLEWRGPNRTYFEVEFVDAEHARILTEANDDITTTGTIGLEGIPAMFAAFREASQPPSVCPQAGRRMNIGE